MISSRTVTATAAQWQAELDAGLETGETPVFYLGQGAGMLGELAGPLALQWLDERRRDTRIEHTSENSRQFGLPRTRPCPRLPRERSRRSSA